MVTDAEKQIITFSYRKYIYSVEWLDKDENTLGEALVDVVSGSANFDATNNCRRSFNLTFRNLDGKYTPSSTSNLWINNRIKIKAGYESLDGTQILYNQGVYILGNPTVLSNPTHKEVSFQAIDKYNLLNGTVSGELKYKYEIEIGTRIDEAIQAVLIDAGETKYIIDTCSTTVPYTLKYSPSDNYSKILEDLGEIVSFSGAYNLDGYFHFTKSLDEIDYDTIPSSWDYTEVSENGVANLYLESNRELQWNDIRNSIAVYGMTDSDLGVQYTAFSSDSTGSELSIDVIGERVKAIEDDKIYTTELAKTRSDYELLKHIKSNESVKTNLIPNFSHDINDVISLRDDSNGCEGNYIIQGISYSLGFNATMNLTLWRVRNIG